jgi:hypothetical protein
LMFVKRRKVIFGNGCFWHGPGLAEKCKERPEKASDLARRVEEFLKANQPPSDPHMTFTATTKP